MSSETAKTERGDLVAGDFLPSPRVSPLSHPLWFWLIVVCSGLGLFVVSHFNYLLFHTLVETSSVALAFAVFLIGWNTRALTLSPLYLILAIGFLGTALIDLLHMLAYKGMGVFPMAGGDLATQFWIAARYLNTAVFVMAALSLGQDWRLRGWLWLGGCLSVTGLLIASIWPLAIFPSCLIEGEGLTPFKIFSEYLISAFMAGAAWLLWKRRNHLNQRLVFFLLVALLLNILSEFSFTLYEDVYGTMNFLGHFFKVAMIILVYAALIEGTLRDPYTTLFRELSDSHRALALELSKRRASEEEKRIVNQEFSLLYLVAKAFHSTLQLDALAHLILSAATSKDGGGFKSAMLFTVNERTGIIQGMLGVDEQSSRLVLPADRGQHTLENPQLDRVTLEAQRSTEFNRRVIKQRLPLDASDNVLAKAFLTRQVLLMPDEKSNQFPALWEMARALGLGFTACVPLLGRHHVLGILLVDIPKTGGRITPGRLRFLELFARQAGTAMENARLIQRLEGAHEELRDVQERLIEGEKLAVLGEMAAQVAHELKNPLVSIGGFAQRLTRLDLGEGKANEYAVIIAREVRRLEEMLANILGFSKKQLVCLETCDIPALIEEALDLEREHCQRQSVDIVVDMPTVLPVTMGDCRQLRQVLLNLIINARQAMPKGGTLTIRVHSGLLRGDEALVLEVEDTGGGIAPEVMRNIFNPFFSTHIKGTGLGLSISHRIIERHHGEIEVQNREAGACFILRLPVKPPSFVHH